MRLSDTFVLELVGLRNRAAQGRLYSDPEAPDLDVILAAQPEADRLTMVDALAAWKAERDRTYPFDWCRATWSTLADAQAYAAYLSAKADTDPDRAEEARLFAVFVEALPAAWARGRDGGDV